MSGGVNIQVGNSSASPKVYNAAFGEMVTTEITPKIDLSNKYSRDPSSMDSVEVFEATGGSGDNSTNLFRCQSGTSSGGYGVIRSVDTIIYQSGQGIEARITAAFTTGVASSLQIAGMFSLTETLAFGYDGADFSVIHEYNGKAEIQALQVTVAASGAETCNVTIDNDAVNNIDVTAGTVQQNAYEIYTGLIADATVSAKWRFEVVDDTINVISRSVGNKTGTFSFTSTGTTDATWTELTAGATKTSDNVAQASWDNPAPFADFDPTMLNLYKITFGYLGVANMDFWIYNPNAGQFVKVHTLKWANDNMIPNFGNPDLKIGWSSTSLGSTTNLTVLGASGMAGVQGIELKPSRSWAASNTVASVDTTLKNLLTIKNRLIFSDQYNLGKISPSTISINLDHNKGGIIEIYENANVAGTPNFQYEDETNSLALVDKAGGAATNGELLKSFTVGANESVSVSLTDLNRKLNPSDELVIAGKTISGTSTNMTASATWLEEF